jgi:hypothetical protein
MEYFLVRKKRLTKIDIFIFPATWKQRDPAREIGNAEFSLF